MNDCGDNRHAVELASRLKEIKKRGPFAVKGRSSGKFGLALEHQLGIAANSSKKPDFHGIEIKTKETSQKTLQTLFSRRPSRFHGEGGKAGMFMRHAYRDEARKRLALYTSFGINPDSLGFRLCLSGNLVQANRHDEVVFEYDLEDLKESLLTKHSQTAFISIKQMKDESGLYCRILGAAICSNPSAERLLKLIGQGKVNLDLTMSMGTTGMVKDHGYLWRCHPNAIPLLYEKTTNVDLD